MGPTPPQSRPTARSLSLSSFCLNRRSIAKLSPYAASFALSGVRPPGSAPEPPKLPSAPVPVPVPVDPALPARPGRSISTFCKSRMSFCARCTSASACACDEIARMSMSRRCEREREGGGDIVRARELCCRSRSTRQFLRSVDAEESVRMRPPPNPALEKSSSSDGRASERASGDRISSASASAGPGAGVTGRLASVLVLMLPKLSPRARLSMARMASSDAWDCDSGSGGEDEEMVASSGSGPGGRGRLMLNGQSNRDSGGAVGENEGGGDSREACESVDGGRSSTPAPASASASASAFASASSSGCGSSGQAVPSSLSSASPRPMRGEMTSP